MIKPGFTITEPVTNTQTIVVQLGREENGHDFIWEVRCPVGAGPFILEHIHQDWKETFKILEGEARYKLNGKEETAKAGDTIVMPAGQHHIHPWNSGDTEMVYQQFVDLPTANPEAVQDIVSAFATLFGMSREGKVDKKGLPKNILQFAATLRTFVKHRGYDSSVPIPVQRIVAATLGRLAETLGYKSSYSRYLQTEEHTALSN